MIDISAFINDPELRPALIGLIGVGVGGLMTVTGQSISRRAERTHKMKEEAASVIGLSHSLRSLYTSYHLDTGTPDHVLDRYLDQLNEDRPHLLKMCQTLIITAPRAVSIAAHHMAETVTAADNYSHPSNGGGYTEGFKLVQHHSDCIAHAEQILGNAARSAWLLRWPRLLLDARRMPRLKQEEPHVRTNN